jgi:uncharacterized protein (DUF58 family)
MADAYLPLIVLLLIVAIFMRDDFALTLIYFVVGTYAAGAWWSNRSLAQVDYTHEFTTHAFLGEKIEVRLRLRNKGWLPVPWLSIRESLPVALAAALTFERVLTLGSHDEAGFVYTLEARKRGYHQIGPLNMTSGHVLGLGKQLVRSGASTNLTVYPKIVPLVRLSVPSRSPHGTLRHTQPIFEDPTRILGKREYVVGDSLRRVDWKSTAASGRMQVKLFEPSIALDTHIFLNLNAEDYHYRSRIDSTELAVVIAASISNWVVEKQQMVGLHVNGRDPLAVDGIPQVVPSGKGRGHLVRILETLARVEMDEAADFTLVIQNKRYHLPWGTTLIVITGDVNEALLDELYRARRSGQNALLIMAGTGSSISEMSPKAGFLGIPIINIASERDLEQMR